MFKSMAKQVFQGVTALVIVLLLFVLFGMGCASRYEEGSLAWTQHQEFVKCLRSDAARYLRSENSKLAMAGIDAYYDVGKWCRQRTKG